MVKLAEVSISSYQLGGDLSHERPLEQISFIFSGITFTDPQSGAKASWDTITNATF